MKQRFSSLDIKVITRELSSEVVNLRVSNIYDLSSRIFLFKLAKPDHRRQLIIDSGFRCHTTQYSRTTATSPSPFVSRLRKFLKSRRVTSVTQIGTDRIIDFAFSDGTFHLFLEFFAGGNIILTDKEYTILALFRQVPAGEAGQEARVGLKYEVGNKMNVGGVEEVTLERIRNTVEKARDNFAKEDTTAGKKSKKKNVDVLRRALSQGFPEYPPLLLDHAFAVRNFDSTTTLEAVLGNDELLQGVMGVLEEAKRVSDELSTDSHPGYIVAKESARESGEGEKKSSQLYEDFHPFKPRQFQDKPGISILEFPRFNTTVDEYFSSIESQKLESRLTEREEAAKRKLDAVRLEHERKIGSLKDVQDLHIRKAGVIEDNVYRVQEAMDAVNGLIAQGMDWVEIARLIEMEQGRGNPVAKIIKLPLKLYENTITLALGEVEDQEDAVDELFSSDESEGESENEEEEQAKAEAKAKESTLTVDIDLGLSPWANATQYYDQKRAAAIKEQKTAQSSSKALKSHEKKVTHDLKRGLKFEKQVLRPARQPFWFEKFLFFISSEGYLVLGGRDAMQSEVLYRRHLKKGDVFVHADLKDATPLIVKNRNANAPIPPSTLSQAGNLCVTTSSAWDSKAVMSAYWVPANQVSKTTTGGLLPTGQFDVKGEKNFLAPSQLVLGFAVMWQISRESLKNHKSRFEVAEPANAVAEDKEQESALQEKDTAETTEEVNGQKESSESEEERADEPIVENPLQPEESESSQPQQASQETEVAEPEEDQNKDQGDVQQEPTKHQEELPEAEDEDRNEAEATPEAQPQQGRDLSARERRMLRQGKSLDGTEGSPTPGIPTSPAKASAKQPSRAKKAKSKKAAAKYAEQDEEERELALRLVGAKSVKAQKAAAAAEAKAKREREAQFQKERRKAQHERAAEAERKRQAAFEEGADDYDEETAAAEAADLSWIPALIGTPHPNDEILAAIPVCAPWAALGRYKYRVKIQPGSVKKGKAVKEIHGKWVAETTTGKVKKEHAEEVGIDRAVAENLRAREGELIKAWKDTEIINTVPVGKVRVMIAGGGDTKGKAKGGGVGGGKGGGGKGGKGGKKK